MSTVYRATDPILERTVAVKILAEHLSDDDALRRPLPPRGARGREADPPQHRPGLRHRASTTAATTSSWSTSRAAPARSCCRPRARSTPRPRSRSASRPAPASTTPTATGSSTATSSPGNLMVIGGPAGGGEMTVKLTDFGIARASRADPDHPGRLGRRHRRLPGARAGARRGGDPGLRRLRARRRPLPVPHRAAALRGRLAGRARDPPAERAARCRPAPTTTTSRRRSATRSCVALEGDPVAPLRRRRRARRRAAPRPDGRSRRPAPTAHDAACSAATRRPPPPGTCRGPGPSGRPQRRARRPPRQRQPAPPPQPRRRAPAVARNAARILIAILLLAAVDRRDRRARLEQRRRQDRPRIRSSSRTSTTRSTLEVVERHQ